MKRAPFISALLLGLLLAMACNTASHFGDIEQGLSQDVGVLTFSQAVERWGQPTSVDHGDKLFTAFWLKEKTGGVVKERLWLTFDNEQKKLRAYRYTSKPFE
ncbi:MAG: hypothetical protein K9K66_06960 [Desulfarculaceae bacterium]|nr:hypothetical protein [Desulfarculaceae bacterium]MCF8071830.1 hypothetical protein [Desulfarculaceae bacterium]MCF8101380.1 hypothetical protein [Desulfarculaceae bacterium]MCF8117159.1 hypothetical protein [Desulfarculaceae bacterium]